MGEVDIEALRDVNFEIEEGEFCVIVGASGAGKTTILNILGGMDTLSEGSVILDGKEISSYNQKQLTTYRRYDIGFVFQFYNLIQNLTALENVELASQISKEPLDAAETLKKVDWGTGSGTSRHSFPAENSRESPSPEHLRRTPSCSCVTSRRGRWITTPERRC